FVQNPREAARGRRLRRCLEEQTVSDAVGVLFLFNGQEQRRLALHHLFQQLRVVQQPFRQSRELTRELKQQLKAIGLGQCLEVIDNFRQCGGQSISTHHFQLTQVRAG